MAVDIRHIRAFRAVAETLSFRRASERLGLAQPALTRTIKDLETALQTQLFQRTTRVTALTESGRVFLKNTANLIGELDRAIDLTQRVHSGFAGELRVGFNDYAIHGLLPPVVRRFRAEHPNVEVVLNESNSPRSAEKVMDDEFDVAFITGPHIQPDLDHIVLREERVVCVLPESHPLAQKKRISITELAEEPFIMGRWANWKSYNRLIRDFCIAHGFVPNLIQEAEHTDGIMCLIAASLGVTLHVDSDWIHALKGISIRPLSERPPETRTCAIWRPNRRSTSPTLDNFIQAIAAEVLEESAIKNQIQN